MEHLPTYFIVKSNIPNFSGTQGPMIIEDWAKTRSKLKKNEMNMQNHQRAYHSLLRKCLEQKRNQHQKSINTHTHTHTERKRKRHLDNTGGMAEAMASDIIGKHKRSFGGILSSHFRCDQQELGRISPDSRRNWGIGVESERNYSQQR